MSSNQPKDKAKKTRPPNLRRTTLDALGLDTTTMCEHCDSTEHTSDKCHIKGEPWKLDAENYSRDLGRYQPDLIDDLEPALSREARMQQNEEFFDLEDRKHRTQEWYQKRKDEFRDQREQALLEFGIRRAMSSTVGESGSVQNHSPIRREQPRGFVQPVRRSKSKDREAADKAKQDEYSSAWGMYERDR